MGHGVPPEGELGCGERQEAVEEMEHRFRNLFAQAATAVYAVDFRTRRLVSVNDYMCEMLGYSREELLAEDPFHFLDEDSGLRFQERIAQWLRGEKPNQNVEYRVRARDGREYWALLDISFTTDEQGRPAGALVIAHDITERKRLEDELRQERELLQAIYDTIPVMLTIYDPKIQQVSVNKHVERVTGWTKADLARTHIMELAYPDAEYRAAVVEYMQSLQPGFRDLLVMAKDGRFLETSWANVALRDGRQVGIGLDVSERKRDERRRARHTAVMEGISRILAQVVVAETEEALATACLAVALEVTGSTFGLVGEVGPDGFLYDTAMSEMAWEDRRVADVAGARRPPGRFALRGLYGIPFLLGQSFFTNDPDSHPEGVDLPAGHPRLTSFLAVPLAHNGHTVGLIAVGNREGGYGPEQQEDLEALAPTVMQALEKKRAEQALVRRTHELEVLNRTNQRLAASLEMDDVLDVTLDELTRLFQGTAGAVWLLEGVLPGSDMPGGTGTLGAKGGALVCRRVRETVPLSVPHLRQRAVEGPAGWVAEHGRSLALSEVGTSPSPGGLYPALLDPYLGITVRAVLSVPLKVKSTVAGVLQVLDARPRTFEERDQSLAESIAAAAGSAVERAQLYEQARRDAEVHQTLLREVNHRVKNNLSAILGLIHAEGHRVKQGDMLDQDQALDDLANRVRSLATVHAILSAGGWKPLEVGELARQIIAAAALPGEDGEQLMSLDLSATSVQVGPEQAHHLALVLSELATNSLKYGRSLEGLRVRLEVGLEGGDICLVYRDGGPGYPSAVLAGGDRSVGLWLVDAIVRTSLRGRVTMANDGGAVTTVCFPADPGGGVGGEGHDSRV
jgi:PAS domain S-box-containing protein